MTDENKEMSLKSTKEARFPKKGTITRQTEDFNSNIRNQKEVRNQTSYLEVYTQPNYHEGMRV